MGSLSLAAVEIAISLVEVLIDFKTYPEKKFAPFLAKVLKCCALTTNTKPPDEVLTPCTRDFDDYNTARANRDAEPSAANTQFVEAAHVKAGLSFEVLAKWVENNCNNNPGIAMTYGFKVAKKNRTAAKRLDAPVKVSYSYDMPGTIVFKCESMGLRVKYMVECSMDGGLTWRLCGMSTKSYRIVAEGLLRSKEYIFRLYGVNNAGNGLPWTSATIVAAV